MNPKIEVYDSLKSAKQEFGENFGAYVFRLTRAQIEALLQGRVVAFDINEGEYAGFLVLDEVEAQFDESNKSEKQIRANLKRLGGV